MQVAGAAAAEVRLVPPGRPAGSFAPFVPFVRGRIPAAAPGTPAGRHTHVTVAAQPSVLLDWFPAPAGAGRHVRRPPRGRGRGRAGRPHPVPVPHDRGGVRHPRRRHPPRRRAVPLPAVRPVDARPGILGGADRAVAVGRARTRRTGSSVSSSPSPTPPATPAPPCRPPPGRCRRPVRSPVVRNPAPLPCRRGGQPGPPAVAARLRPEHPTGGRGGRGGRRWSSSGRTGGRWTRSR